MSAARRCPVCGTPLVLGRPTPATPLRYVHERTGAFRCPPNPAGRCPVPTPSHTLADGTPCPDPRHPTRPTRTDTGPHPL